MRARKKHWRVRAYTLTEMLVVLVIIGLLAAIVGPRLFSRLDDAKAPDYARTVDIHSKPGYDPVELFVDPKLLLPGLTVAGKLFRRQLGFRTLLDVIPLDTSLVRGSHGLVTEAPEIGPVFLSSHPELVPQPSVNATDVKDLILQHIFG